MKLRFLDRKDEQRRLRRAAKLGGGALAVIYGRRRCGKSTLLQHMVSDGDVYYLADQNESVLQIRDLAAEIDRIIPGFSSASYAGWDTVLRTLDDRLRRPISLCLDEFPYLVQASSALPSQIQKYLDLPGPKKLNITVCGSSQRMMHGLVMDKSAPLYGRAVEVLKIEPLKAGWIRKALDLRGSDAVTAYSVWGGVPRYWELSALAGTVDEAIREHVLDPNGVLHNEPMRLLLDDMRSAVQPYSLLYLIGQGCHRLSEIAGRLGKPATSLQRPLVQLVDLGYIRRETPFGGNEKKSRKTLYKICDPFLLFYFRFLEPNKSQLEIGRVSPVLSKVRGRLEQHVATVWEDMARTSVPFSEIGGHSWEVARRWWGGGIDGKPVEVDVVAESTDGKAVLVGEVKWQAKTTGLQGAHERIKAFAANLPFVKGRKIVPVVWSRQGGTQRGLHAMAPDAVLDCLQ